MPALPNADIAAFVRGAIRDGTLYIHIYWASHDKVLSVGFLHAARKFTQRAPFQVLHQRVSAGEWLPDSPIGYLAACGALAGSMTGRYFSDNDSSVDSKVIHKVQVRVRDVVEGISLEFTDGSATPWRGGKTGTLQEFVLHDGEDITRVSICSDGTVIQKLSFHTSFGQFRLRSRPFDR